MKKKLHRFSKQYLAGDEEKFHSLNSLRSAA